MSRAKSIERRDYSHEVRKHQLLWVRLAFAALGTLFLMLGIIGIFMPILPTTPFLLLATACYARSSRRFYNWLMNHPAFGPLIVEWRTYRSIPWRVKLVAVHPVQYLSQRCRYRRAGFKRNTQHQWAACRSDKLRLHACFIFAAA